MNYKETVRNCCLKYPSIFPNALTVADHLFLVCGNGYEWEGGELVTPETRDQKKSITVQEAIERNVTFELTPGENPSLEISRRMMFKDDEKHFNDEFDRYLKHTKEHILEDVRMSFDIDRRVEDFTVPRPELYPEYCKMYEVETYSLYPLYSSAAILHLPDDIKPDWLDAATRMFHFVDQHRELIRDKYTKPEDTERFLTEVANRIREIRAARLPKYSALDDVLGK